MRNMTKDDPAKLIFYFAVPILSGNLLQLTYSLADTRMVGSFLGEEALAAVGSTTILNSLMIGFLMGLANGFAIMTAQKFGAKDVSGVRQSFAAALLLGVGLSAALTICSLVFLSPILHFLNVPESLMAEAKQYIWIILIGMIITILYDILMAVMRAIGDSMTPLIILAISVVLNILGDLFLLGILKTGVWGAAFATVLSQAAALGICTVWLVKKYDILHLQREDFTALHSNMVKNMLSMGLSMGLMSSLVNIGSLILQTAINELGEVYIVAQTAARKITELLMSVFIVIGQTMATYCGQNYGAGEYQRIEKGIRIAVFYTMIWCVVVLFISYTLSPQMIYMITGSHNQEIIQNASDYLKFDTTFYFVVAIIFVLRNSLQGIGDRITPLISSGLEMLGKIVMAATLVPLLGYRGVILVEPIVWFIMVIPLMTKMRKYYQNYKNIV